jgi:hypothetical protein
MENAMRDKLIVYANPCCGKAPEWSHAKGMPGVTTLECSVCGRNHGVIGGGILNVLHEWNNATTVVPLTAELRVHKLLMGDTLDFYIPAIAYNGYELTNPITGAKLIAQIELRQYSLPRNRVYLSLIVPNSQRAFHKWWEAEFLPFAAGLGDYVVNSGSSELIRQILNEVD